MYQLILLNLDYKLQTPPIISFKSEMDSLYYEFELKVLRIYLELDSACDVQFWWKRGKQKATSKKYRINERVQYV